VGVEAREGLEATIPVIYQVFVTEWDCDGVFHAADLRFFGSLRLYGSDGGRCDRSVDPGPSCNLV
jgi:hypothetical protein